MVAFDSGYFESNYRCYEAQNPNRKLSFYLRCIEHFSAVKSDLDFLEIGCGLGPFLEYLSNERPRYRLSGTDLSVYAIAKTQRRIPSAKLLVASAEQTVWPEKTFDVICAFDVIEHVPDLELVRESVERMLKPGGIFVVVVPVYDGLSGPIISVLDKDPTHVHKHPRRFWLNWGCQAFSLIYWTGIIRYLLPWNYYVHWPTGILRNHTPALLAVFRHS